MIKFSQREKDLFLATVKAIQGCWGKLIYLSVPFTLGGKATPQQREKFAKDAQAQIISLYDSLSHIEHDYDFINPIAMEGMVTLTWEEWMEGWYHTILNSKLLILGENYEISKGCLAEKEYAESIGLKTVKIKDFLANPESYLPCQN